MLGRGLAELRGDKQVTRSEIMVFEGEILLCRMGGIAVPGNSAVEAE